MMAQFWVTTACNMKCAYCYEGIEKENLYMSEEIADRAIEYTIKHFNKISENEIIISFHGGEPLLNFKIIKYIYEKITLIFKDKHIKPQFWITTNLFKVNNEILSFLADNMDSISVSIDGSEYYNDLNRTLLNGLGTYNVVSENAKKLLAKRNDLRARMTVNNDTYEGLFLNVKHLYEIGFKLIVPVLDYYDDRWNNQSLEKLYSNLKKLAEFLVEKEGEDIDLKLGFIKNVEMKRKNSCCDGGVTSISIDPLGMIYPCTQSVGHKDFIIGSIFEGIDPYKLKYISDLDKIENNDCIGCSRYKYCTGTRCKLINKIFNGDYHTPSPLTCAEQSLLIDIYDYYKELKEDVNCVSS